MYIEHYNLLGRPFQLTPDARFYFDSATHKKAMAYLGYGLSQGEGFIVITGEIGSGKTTLVEHLKLTIDRSRLKAIHVVSTQIEADDMLRSVAQQLGISTNDLAKGEVLMAVEKALHVEARQGRRVLLIVDEAQNLPFSAIEELRMLSNFQLGPESLVQIFLLGQPEFRESLNKDPKLEQVRQRVIATHHLEAIGADEIEGYLVHRLAACGWQGNPDFTPEAVALIHHQSGGVPRLINILAGRVMLHGAIEDLTVIDGDAVRSVIADLGARGPEKVDDPLFEAPDEQESEFDGSEYGYDKLMVKAEAKKPIQFEEETVLQEVEQDIGVAEHSGPQVSQLAQESARIVHPQPVAEAVQVPPPVAVPTDSWEQDRDPTSAQSWVSARYLEIPEADVAPPPHEEPAVEPAQEVSNHGTPASEEYAPSRSHQDFGADAVIDALPRIEDEMFDKLALLEARIEEQDAALRRVLTLLVDWAEDERKPLPNLGNFKGFAA